MAQPDLVTALAVWAWLSMEAGPLTAMAVAMLAIRIIALQASQITEDETDRGAEVDDAMTTATTAIAVAVDCVNSALLVLLLPLAL